MKTIVDTAAARELELYADNTYEIYNRHAMPTVENLKKSTLRVTTIMTRPLRRGNM